MSGRYALITVLECGKYETMTSTQHQLGADVQRCCVHRKRHLILRYWHYKILRNKVTVTCIIEPKDLVRTTTSEDIYGQWHCREKIFWKQKIIGDEEKILHFKLS
ncbi:hypothetical protein RB195_018669 [Necator americanus]|uniref:Uncharacterized protein n=1 Tax=Necator americanus TaxID=51031 RepID=A0ABR1CD38_NECAM